METKSESREQRIERFRAEAHKPGYAAHIERLERMSDRDYYQVYFPAQGRLIRGF